VPNAAGRGSFRRPFCRSNNGDISIDRVARMKKLICAYSGFLDQNKSVAVGLNRGSTSQDPLRLFPAAEIGTQPLV